MKAKTYGPSNDDVPHDELVLAKAVAAAKAGGWGVLYGPSFRVPHGTRHLYKFLVVEGPGAKACCSSGAAELAGLSIHEFRGIASGHEGWSDDKEYVAYDAGVAFADAMG